MSASACLRCSASQPPPSPSPPPPRWAQCCAVLCCAALCCAVLCIAVLLPRAHAPRPAPVTGRVRWCRSSALVSRPAPPPPRASPPPPSPSPPPPRSGQHARAAASTAEMQTAVPSCIRTSPAVVFSLRLAALALHRPHLNRRHPGARLCWWASIKWNGATLLLPSSVHQPILRNCVLVTAARCSPGPPPPSPPLPPPRYVCLAGHSGGGHHGREVCHHYTPRLHVHLHLALAAARSHPPRHQGNWEGPSVGGKLFSSCLPEPTSRFFCYRCLLPHPRRASAAHGRRLRRRLPGEEATRAALQTA